jgi:hypothetical protein
VTASQEDSEQQMRWQNELERLIAKPETPLAIQNFLGKPMKTSARPVRAFGADNQTYIVKGAQAGRQIINDQLVGRLGMLLEAAVAEVTIVEVDPILTTDPTEPEFAYFCPGLAHGSLFISGCMDDRSIIRYQTQSVNRDRLARLSLLYGWVGAADRQFLYKSIPPHVIYSVDHGHFLPGGPDWTIKDLQNAPPVMLDSEIVRSCRFKDTEIQGALMALLAISESEILQVVARLPEEWGITIEERVALMTYLTQRRFRLLQDGKANVINEEGT